MSEIDSFTNSLFGGMMFFYAALFIIGGLSQLFLGLCVYNDAKYRLDKNPGMWGILSAFFQIGALIYIIIKLTTKTALNCLNCNAPLFNSALHCNYCGAPTAAPPAEQMADWNKKRKLYLGLWIGTQVLIVLVTIVFIGLIFAGTIDLFEQIDYNHYDF